MSRFAKRSIIEELKNRMIEASKDEWYETEDDLNPINIKDKIPSEDFNIVFDCENFVTPLDKYIYDNCKNENDIEFIQLDNFPIALCYAGGDWEYPVWFCIYIDDNNKLRVYVPYKGNTFNKYTKTAFGSEEHTNLDPIKVWNEIPDLWKNDISKEVNETYDFEFSDYFYTMLDEAWLESKNEINSLLNINDMIEEIKDEIKVKE